MNLLILVLFMETLTAIQYVLPGLTYPRNALQPAISENTVNNHYGKHFQTYVNNLNKLVPGTEFEGKTVEDIVRQAPDGPLFNKAGQVLNHTLYFEQFIPTADYKGPGETMMQAINYHFGSMEELKKQMNEAAMTVFGSGWVWLSMDIDGRMLILKEANGGNPLRQGMFPLVGIDCWEHSWYLDFAADKASHYKALWDIINWEVVEGRMPFTNSDYSTP